MSRAARQLAIDLPRPPEGAVSPTVSGQAPVAGPARASVAILGCDPGFSSFGFSVLRVGGRVPELLALGDIRTKKAGRKQNLLAVDDNLRRCQEIYRALDEVITEHHIRVICAESFSPPRSSSVAAKVALAWGALIGVAEAHGIVITQESPQGLKKHLCGKRDASKEEMAVALSVWATATRNVEVYERDLSSLPKTEREHPIDALAAAVTCMDRDVVRLVLAGVAA